MTNKVSKIFVFFLALFLPTIIAADSPNIVINEIAWMGTNNSANDEWVVPQTLTYPLYLG